MVFHSFLAELLKPLKYPVITAIKVSLTLCLEGWNFHYTLPKPPERGERLDVESVTNGQ